MKIKTKRGEKFVMCACCGKTFKANEATADELFNHQAENKECKGYFKIDVIN